METLKTLWKRISDGTIIEVLREWKWILQYSRKYWKAILFYMFLGIFSTIFSLISSIAGQQLIDIVTGQQESKLLGIAIVMVSMALFSLFFSSYIGRVSLKLSIDIQNDIQSDIFNKIQDAGWYELTHYHSGDLLNRFTNDVSTVAGNAITWLPSLVINTFNLVATFCVIFHYDHVMAFLSLTSAPILLGASQYLMGRMRNYSKRVKELNSQVMSFEQETFYNMNTIKAFGITDRYAQKLKGWQQKYKEYNLDYNMFSIKTNIVLALVGMVSQYAAYGWGVYRLWTHHITYGEMTLFLGQGSKLAGAFNSLVSFLPTALNSSVSAGRVMELVNLPREKHDEASAQKVMAHAEDGLTVKLHDVYFSYDEKRQILTQSEFVAAPGEIVAIVGPSGEGKTTMLRLILGLIMPKKGQAVLVDASGEETPMSADIRTCFAYVPQGNTLFSGTIAENLRMVREDATDEELIDALKISCAWEFVQRLPDGMETKLGEHGNGLSEGQAQRIAIARAIVRNAPVLLLDEATSALDVDTERRVLRNIMNCARAKTCIMATHRPSVLNMCARVYRVMDTQVTQLDETAAQKMVQDF